MAQISGWVVRRRYSIDKLKTTFPNDAEAIEALAEMNPTKMPRLEPYREDDAEDVPILINAFTMDTKWKVVWE